MCGTALSAATSELMCHTSSAATSTSTLGRRASLSGPHPREQLETVVYIVNQLEKGER